MTWFRSFLQSCDPLFGPALFVGCEPGEKITAFCWRRGYTKWIKSLDFLFGVPRYCRASYMLEKAPLPTCPKAV